MARLKRRVLTSTVVVTFASLFTGSCRIRTVPDASDAQVRFKEDSDPCRWDRLVINTSLITRTFTAIKPNSVDDWVRARYAIAKPQLPYSATFELLKVEPGLFGGERYLWQQRSGSWELRGSNDKQVRCLAYIQLEPHGDPLGVVKTIGAEAARILGFQLLTEQSGVKKAVTPSLRELQQALDFVKKQGAFLPLQIYDAAGRAKEHRVNAMITENPVLKNYEGFADQYIYLEQLAGPTPSLPLATEGYLYFHDLTYHAMSFAIPKDLIQSALERVRLVWKVIEVLEQDIQNNHKAIFFLLKVFGRSFDVAEGSSLLNLLPAYRESNGKVERTWGPFDSSTQETLPFWEIYLQNNSTASDWLRNLVHRDTQIYSFVMGSGILGPKGKAAIQEAADKVLRQIASNNEFSFANKKNDVRNWVEHLNGQAQEQIENVRAALLKFDSAQE